MLLTYTSPDSWISEQFRNIRTYIQFRSNSLERKSLLITSPGAGQGKTMAASNLAMSLAHQKEKVLLIDANLRRPQLHEIFKVSNKTGLADAVKGFISFEAVVQHTPIRQLELITSGSVPANPSDLFGCSEMKPFMDWAEEHYDAVIVDSYPILEMADTKLLANLCGGVVLVLNSNKSKRSEMLEMRRIVQLTEAELVGTILNEI